MATRRRWGWWACLLLGTLIAGLAFFGDTPQAGAQEEEEEEGQAPWANYDPGPAPRDGDDELYHGDDDTADNNWEEDDGCEHRYYAWGTPYWDCHSRGMSGDPDTHDGECEEDDFYFLDEEGRFVSVDGETREHDTAFVVCQDDNGPYTGDDFMQVEAPGEDEHPEALDPKPDPFYAVDGARYRVCTNRPSRSPYGTDWMHCPTFGFRTVPCIETQGAGFAVSLPVLGEVQVGDENEGFWEALSDGFGDQFEARIVPDVQGPASGADGDLSTSIERASQRYGDDLTWWYQDIAAESESEQGKGCSLAETPPTYRSCHDINDDRDHAQAVLDAYEDADGADEGETGDVMTGTLSQRRREEAYYEEQIRDIESQGGVIPDTCFGTFPTDAYRVFYDSGDSFNVTEWGGQLMATLGEMAFGLLKLAVSGALWLIRTSLTMDVTEYRQMVAALAENWDVQIVQLGGGHTSFMDIAWFAVFATAAFLALRRQGGRGAGEIAGSMVMATLGGVLLAGAFTPGGYFDSAAGLVDTASRGMLLAGSGCDANDELDAGEVEQLIGGRYDDCGDDAADGAAVNQGGFGGVIHHEFVETPFRYINWGTDDLSRNCEAAENRLLRLTGMGHDYATRLMERAGCVDEANHSGQMTVGRLTSVLAVVAVGLFVAVLLLSIAFTLLVSKFVVAALFAALPLFVVAAIFPGGARRPAIWWVEQLVKVWVLALVVGALLAGGLVAFQTIAEATQGRSMVERQMIFLVVLVILWSCYRQADRGGQIVASAGGRQLGQVLSPSASWASTGAGLGVGGGGGIPLTGPARVLSATGIAQTASVITAGSMASMALGRAGRGLARGASSPGRVAGRSLVTRNAERRVANRSIKNLVNRAIMMDGAPVATPTTTRGLHRAVRQLRRQHGNDYINPKPGGSGPGPGRSTGPARSSTTALAARRDIPRRPSGTTPSSGSPRSGTDGRAPGVEAGGRRDRGRRSWSLGRQGGGDAAASRRTGAFSWIRGRRDGFDVHRGREPLRHTPPTEATLNPHGDRRTGTAGGGTARTDASTASGSSRPDTAIPTAATARSAPASPASARQRAADAQAARQGELESHWGRVAGSYERYQRDLGREQRPGPGAAQIRQQYAREIAQANYLYKLNTGKAPPPLHLPWESGPDDA